MDWKDLGGKLLNMGLPLVGTVLAGPAGAGAGVVIARTISSALGIKGDNPQEIYDAIVADPNLVMELKKYELQHQQELQRLALDGERLAIEDRISARQREMAVVQATGKKDINLYVMGWLVVIGTFALIAILMFIPLPEGQSEIVYVLLGTVGSGGFAVVLQYFFGSSKGSADKTALMAFKRESKDAAPF